MKIPGKGSKQVGKVTGKSPTNTVPGTPGKSVEQKAFAGPKKTGLPTSMKKALRK